MKTIPVENRAKSQPFVVGGCIIRKEDKFVLVKEGIKGKENGTWNHPAGWIDLYENLIEGSKREAEEETGLNIKIIGLLGVYTLLKKSPNTGKILHAVKFIFAAEPLSNEFKPMADEIMDAKWFTIDEIKKLKEENSLRDHDIINQVQDFLNEKIFPIEIIDKFYEQIG